MFGNVNSWLILIAMLVLRCDTATTQGASLGELIPLVQQQLFLIRAEFFKAS